MDKDELKETLKFLGHFRLKTCISVDKVNSLNSDSGTLDRCVKDELVVYSDILSSYRITEKGKEFYNKSYKLHTYKSYIKKYQKNDIPTYNSMKKNLIRVQRQNIELKDALIVERKYRQEMKKRYQKTLRRKLFWIFDAVIFQFLGGTDGR